MTYMFILKCALKLVEEIILFVSIVSVFSDVCLFRPTQDPCHRK